MNKEVFFNLLRKLEGINYFFIAGLSVAIHSKGQRIPNDVDVAIHRKNIESFSRSIGVIPLKRIIDKGTFLVRDFGFEANFKGLKIEVTTGYPEKRVKDDTFNKLFNKKIKSKYLGRSVFVEPLEELVTQKAFMHREKDLNDLNLLRNRRLDKLLVLELAKDKGKEKEILDVLRKKGFEI